MESRYKVNSKISLLKHFKIIFLLSFVWIFQSNAAELCREIVTSRYIDILQLPTVKRQVNCSELQQELQAISSQIQNGLNEGDANKIMAAHMRFEALESEDANWQQQALGLVYKWSSQTNWREAIGGHLFFPHQTFMWEMLDVEKYRLSRRDTVISLACGVKYKHPICMYYLAQILEEIHTSSTDAPISQVIPSLFGQAYALLQRHDDNPDACYVMGKFLTSSPSIFQEGKIVPIWCKPQEAVRWHERGLQDIKNRYAILRVKSNFKADFDPVTSDEFLQLARVGFPLAYLDAACLQEGFDQKQLILQEAITAKCGPAFIALGSLYEDRYIMKLREGLKDFTDLDRARSLYKQAGDLGFYFGYVQCGRALTGPITFDSSPRLHNNIRTLPHEVMADIVSLFQLAVKGHHPDGCDYLAEFTYILYHQESDSTRKEKLERLYFKALEEGVKLGSVLAYSKFKQYFPDQLQPLIDKYGPALQEKAFQDLIRKLIQN